MKFIKVIIDGKEYYQKIDDCEAVEIEKAAEETKNETSEKYESEENETSTPESEPEVVDARIEGGEELSGGEKFKKDTQESPRAVPLVQFPNT